MWDAGEQRSATEVILGDEGGGEELILKGHPVEGLFNLLVNLLGSLIQVVRAAEFLLVGDGGVAVLKRKALLLLTGQVVPLDVHLLVVGRKDTGQSVCCQREVQQVVLAETIVEHDAAAIACLGSHGDG